MWSFPSTPPAQDVELPSPLVGADGTIFLAGEALWALRPDGSQLWKKDLTVGYDFPRTPALAPDGTLYAVGGGKLFALDSVTGQERWTFLDQQLITSPLVGIDGTVYVGSEGALYALDSQYHSQRWSQPIPELFPYPAQGTDGSLLVVAGFSLLALDSKDGTIHWKFTPGDGKSRLSPPSVAGDGTILFGTTAGSVSKGEQSRLYAVRPDGTQLWEALPGAGIPFAPAVSTDGTIYAADEEGVLHAVNADGIATWVYAANGPLRASPTIDSRGTVLVCSADQYLYAIQPDGSPRWKLLLGAIPGTPAVLGEEDTIGLTTLDGVFRFLAHHTITLVQPNGGEIAPAGKEYTVRWSTTHLPLTSLVEISYSLDGGQVWVFVANVSAALGAYVWKVPGVSNNQARIRLRWRIPEPSSEELGEAVSAKDFTLSFNPPPVSSPTPTTSISFRDLPNEYWASGEIAALVKRKAINGYPDGTFRPEAKVKRSEFAKMAVLALNLPLVLVEYPTFPDVPGNHWALTYVETAYANDLVKGYPDGTFRPDGEVALAEVLTVIVRAKGWNQQDLPATPVILVEEADGSIRNMQPDDWFRPIVGTAVIHELLRFPEDSHLAKPGGGSGEWSLAFNSPTTRAQTAFLLARMFS